MNVDRIGSWCILAAFVALGATIGLNQHVAAQQPAGLGANGAEIQTRGPVHEAFAETVSFDPRPGVVTPKAPPAAIDEPTPRQRPEGKNLAWIPGYWAWDDERNDFLWLSGIWRALPPGHQWVPGYWAKAQQGAQWTSGYWADANATEAQYLPKPPASVEEGPNVAAPSIDQNWLPGSWVWQQNCYAWRPGYWAAGNQDWDWVPDHYVWTPRGYVFVDAGAKDPARSSFTRSPFVAPADQLDVKNAPPKRHQVLQPDPRATPQPKTRVGQAAPLKDDRHGAADDSQPQAPKSSLKFDSKDQPKVQETIREKSKDASSNPQEESESHSKGKRGKD